MLTIDINNQPMMKCLCFRVGRVRPLRIYINKLRNIANIDITNFNVNRKRNNEAYESALKLSILKSVFDYMSRCNPKQLKYILKDSSKQASITCNYFTYIDPLRLTPKSTRGFKLIKRIFVSNKSLPIFELRINHISTVNIDFGFRCIFFCTKHSIDKSVNLFSCQCYTNYFHKRKYSGKNHKIHAYLGNKITNHFGEKTALLYNYYKKHPDNFRNEFCSNNIII